MSFFLFGSSADNPMSGIGDKISEQLKAVPWLDKAIQEATWPPSQGYLKEFVLPIFAAAFVLFLIHFFR